ncbi:unnamed protein product [Amaranthus hypochondriacus]
MLLKTVFHGVADSWIVFADVWAPALSQNLDVCKHLELSPHTHYDVDPLSQHPVINRVKRSMCIINILLLASFSVLLVWTTIFLVFVRWALGLRLYKSQHCYV